MFGNVYGASLNSGDPSSSSDSGLSGGAIAGIVIGTLVGVSALVALGALALRSRRKGGRCELAAGRVPRGVPRPAWRAVWALFGLDHRPQLGGAAGSQFCVLSCGLT
jgi:hypothetical protein